MVRRVKILEDGNSVSWDDEQMVRVEAPPPSPQERARRVYDKWAASVTAWQQPDLEEREDLIRLIAEEIAKDRL